MSRSDQEIANFIIEASKEEDEIKADGAFYIKAISSIARRKGIKPYIRMISAFPFSQAQMIVSGLEAKGSINSLDASTLRNDITVGSCERARIDRFFSELTNQCGMLAGKTQIARSTSIAECIRNSFD